jgi:pteridine reductase
MNGSTESLIGKTALVTGAARRLGRATALALAQAGANVVVHYHTHAAEAQSLADEIKALGRKAWTNAADLRDASQAESLMEQSLHQAGAVDILINNASIFPSDTVLDLLPETLAEAVAIHATAPLILSRRLAAQGQPGAIVNFLDSRVEDYDPTHASYHLSKRMLLALTRMLAVELAPRITVNAVAPGLILPPEGQDESYLQNLAHTNPLQRYGNPRDITDAVLFLLRSEFVTGQVIFVDGGRHLKGKTHG